MENSYQPSQQEEQVTSEKVREVAVKGLVEEGEGKFKEENAYEYTMDGSVDMKGKPAAKGRTGGWVAGWLVLVNQGLVTLAFFGVSVNLVLFLTRVLQQDNADAANNVSKWTGTVYIFSLIGALLSDSYWGRYTTCAIFQAIFVLGLVMLSLSSQLVLLRPSGCGDRETKCGTHSAVEVWVFYSSLYLIGLGYGGYQPNSASFGADQFEEDDPREARSKTSFFSYFYLALNLGSLFSNTFLSYLQDRGMWALGFWASAGSALLALAVFLGGTHRYRHFRPAGNPVSSVCQVAVAAVRKWTAGIASGGEGLYEMDGKECAEAAAGYRRMLHTDGLKFLDRAAVARAADFTAKGKAFLRDPWRLCTVTQVEEVKRVLHLLPIWLCTIPYSVAFTQMASLFVVQGAAMRTDVLEEWGGFRVPAASMSAFDILSVALVILLNRRLLDPLVSRLRSGGRGSGLTELERMGCGLVVAVLAMASAGAVEQCRLRRSRGGGSSLSIMWQVPQYALVGASEVFMYVGQLEFFNAEAPAGLKSFGSALCMASISFGNFASDVIVTAVMGATGRGGRPGWIPEDLNVGHMDRFFFLLAALTSADLVVYLCCAKWYKRSKMEAKFGGEEGLAAEC
ncbi:protein NRT1/ PTR FAMILY 7.3-like [Iris pallida]|uniref:Protein NRT1/ PTR FAMILY 7.3-like n=1 Tax=Iris pallida TaxID=29817 RepID=A0AAX6HYN7_IRIPA|nr:protein NRT1/ PTR FAMILY 7.3-like [Iris pallida]